MNACYLEKWNETIVLLLSIDSVNIVFEKNKHKTWVLTLTGNISSIQTLATLFLFVQLNGRLAKEGVSACGLFAHFFSNGC